MIKKQSGIEFGKEIVKEINKRIKKTYWTNEQITLLFAKRSVSEILDSGETFFMNPCSDFTFVSSFLMYQGNISHRWIIEKHPPTEKFNFQRLHFLLEYMYDKKPHVLNYKQLNNVYIYEGIYKGREDLLNSEITKIPREEICFNKSIYKNLLNLKNEKILEGYSLEKNLEKLKKDNSIENFQNFKKLYGESFQFK